MNTFIFILFSAVTFIECPKCTNRLRITPDGASATINLSRISPAERDKMAARAERLIHFADDVGKLDFKRPLMGWSSWNTFAVDISEDIILETARTMATNGLAAAGYRYVNIDDGFFGGRDAAGHLLFHPTRFPRGLKPTVDGIHALGLKAGIYSEGGTNTCGSIWNNDGYGCTSGLYGHDADDCRLFFNDLEFDFIKVDYCGGKRMNLDEQKRYTEIGKAIRATGREVRFNVCRWAYPGTWVSDLAESWRTTEDIRASWKSVRKLIKENLYLSTYAKLGHYNDMDMLEVGRRKGQLKSVFGKSDTGLTESEEVAHFGMWCMLSSPLLIGCDVRTMPEFTRKLVTNRYLLSMNQNDLGVQGRVAARQGEVYLLVKDAEKIGGTSRFAALLNLGEEDVEFKLEASALNLSGKIAAFDLYEKADVGEFEGEIYIKLPKRSAKFYLMDGEGRTERRIYEAEDAFLSTYQELKDPNAVGTPYFVERPGASGGVQVANLGAGSKVIWRDVEIRRPGKRKLTLRVSTPFNRGLSVFIDGVQKKSYYVLVDGGDLQTLELEAELSAGTHVIQLAAESGFLPDVDCLLLD